MKFFKALFGSKEEKPEEKKKAEEAKNFDVLKYDGVRALRAGQAEFAIRCFTHALQMQDDLEIHDYLSQAYIRIGELTLAYEQLQKLAALPPETLICSGHEYTASNLRFARTLEPDNPRLISRIAEVAAKRAQGIATVPVPLRVELDTNPYLRAHLPALKTAVGLPDADAVTVFAEIRARKDRF